MQRVRLPGWEPFLLFVLVSATAPRFSSCGEPASLHVRFFDSETGYGIPVEEVSLSGEDAMRVLAPNYIPLITPALKDDSSGPRIRVWLDPLERPTDLDPELIRSFHRPDATVLLGFVVDNGSGKPLKGVCVEFRPGAADLTWFEPLKTFTDDRGFFRLSVPCAEEDTDGRSDTSLAFTKTGFEVQEYRNLELWPNGDWTYRVRLSGGPQGPPVALGEKQSRRRTAADSVTDQDRPDIKEAPVAENGSLNSATDQYGLSLEATVRVPRSIRVLNADGVTVDYVSLEYYCRRVLPAEWIAGWAGYAGGSNSLNAGAVAIRTYAVGSVNKPRAAGYDICGTTACQVYGPATSTYSDAAVSATAGYVMTSGGVPITPGLTEYSAENNSLNFACGDGFASPTAGCLEDPVCAGEPRNGHGRGLCQWGSARWATGLKFRGNSTRDHTTPNGLPRRDWLWILAHYYPSLSLAQGRPLDVGDIVEAAVSLNVRACPDGSINGGAQCPVLATLPAGRAGVILEGPVQIATDGAGYTWYRIRWGNLTGWSVENYVQRLMDGFGIHAASSQQGVAVQWTAHAGLTYRVQSKEDTLGTWRDLSDDLGPQSGPFSWTDSRPGNQRFYRVRVVAEP